MYRSIERILQKVHGRGASQAQELDNAINFAVRVMTMVNCSTQRQPTGILEQGSHRVPWRSDITMSQYVTSIFPTTDHPRYLLIDTVMIFFSEKKRNPRLRLCVFACAYPRIETLTWNS